MSRCSRNIILAAFSILSCGNAASAGTLRCQSVNGNLNCTGSGGASCQTIDGKQVCLSGQGDIVQSFGGGRASVPDAGDADEGLDEGLDDAPSGPVVRRPPLRRDPHRLPPWNDRDGTKRRVENDWLSIDRDQ